MTSLPNDGLAMSVNNIKSSKLFRKFLETEQSDSASSVAADNTFQSNSNLARDNKLPKEANTQPSSNSNAFKNREFDGFLRASQAADKRQNNFQANYTSDYQLPQQQQNSTNSAQFLPQQQSNSISDESIVSHSYFQPPTGQFNVSDTMNNITQHSLNLSQIFDSNNPNAAAKKLRMSPDRYYFHPTTLLNSNNPNNIAASNRDVNQPATIIEDDRDLQMHSENLSNNQHTSSQRSQISQDQYYFQQQQMSPTQQLQQNQVQQIDQINHSQDQYAQPSPQRMIHNNTSNSYNNIHASQMMLQEQQQQHQQQLLQQQQQQQQQQYLQYQNNSQLFQQHPQYQLQYNQHPIPPHNNLFHSSSASAFSQQIVHPLNSQQLQQSPPSQHQSQLIARVRAQTIDDNQQKEQYEMASQNSKKIMILEENLAAIAEKLKISEEKNKTLTEQLSHDKFNVEKEQLKAKAFESTIGDLRKAIVTLEAEKTELRAKFLSETETKTREIQAQISTASSLKSAVKDVERREEQLRIELEKTKQSLFKEEANKKKLEEEIREYKAKAKESNDTMQQLQKRQDSRDDEVLQLKLQAEQLKEKLTSLVLNNERNSERLNESQRQAFRDVGEKEESQRKVSEYQQRVQTYLVESERLKNENYSLSRQLHENQLRQEGLQSEVYNQREMLLEKSQKHNMVVLSLDKAQLEIAQLKSLVVRIDSELKESKDQNYRLVKNLADIAAKNNGVMSEKQIPQSVTEQLMKTNTSNDNQDPIADREQSNGYQQYQAKSEQKINENSQQGRQQQLQQYQRGRLSSELEADEEEVKMNSPGRLRYRPKDNNIFGGNSDSNNGNTYQQYGQGMRNHKLSHSIRQSTLSPPMQDRMGYTDRQQVYGNSITQKGIAKDDSYQRNPNKIGSLSPPREDQYQQKQAAGVRRTQQGFQMDRQGQGGDQQGTDSIMNIEQSISKMTLQKSLLDNELKKLEDTKRKSGADLRRKAEVSREIEDLERNIQTQRLTFRQLTALQ